MKTDRLFTTIMLSTALTLFLSGCTSGSTPISKSKTDSGNASRNEEQGGDLQKQLDDLRKKLSKAEESANNGVELENIQDQIKNIEEEIDVAMEIANDYLNPADLKHSNKVARIGINDWMLISTEDNIENEATTQTEYFQSKQSWTDADNFCKNFESKHGETGWKLPTLGDIISLDDQHGVNNTLDKINVDKIFDDTTFPADNPVFIWYEVPDTAILIKEGEKPNLEWKTSTSQFFFTCIKYAPEKDFDENRTN